MHVFVSIFVRSVQLLRRCPRPIALLLFLCRQWSGSTPMTRLLLATHVCRFSWPLDLFVVEGVPRTSFVHPRKQREILSLSSSISTEDQVTRIVVKLSVLVSFQQRDPLFSVSIRKCTNKASRSTIQRIWFHSSAIHWEQVINHEDIDRRGRNIGFVECVMKCC